MLSTASVLKRPRPRTFGDCTLPEYSPAVIALCASPYASIRRVRCYVRDGVARLEGRLPTYHQKQLAQEIVRRAQGIHLVDNRIVVQNQDWARIGAN